MRLRFCFARKNRYKLVHFFHANPAHNFTCCSHEHLWTDADENACCATYCANPCERACSCCPGGRVCGWNRLHLGYVIVFALSIILQLILMIVLLVPSGRDAVLAQLADNHAGEFKF